MSPCSDNYNHNKHNFYNQKSKESAKNFGNFNLNRNYSYENEIYNDIKSISTNNTLTGQESYQDINCEEKKHIFPTLSSPKFSSNEIEEVKTNKQQFLAYNEGNCNYLIFTQAITPCLGYTSSKTNVFLTNSNIIYQLIEKA